MPPVFRATVGAAAVATFTAALLRFLEPFEHGIWLISYLLLVGTVAQFLLCRGQGTIAPDTPPTVLWKEALLWSFGVVTVPLGVLTDKRLLIVSGSVTLLIALFYFRAASKRRTDQKVVSGTGTFRAYQGLLAFMTLSVFVGVALAWNTPWI